ncbi:hypothetical protein F4821DRAFT_214247 [Hypoxylon rubiginosum]|uniref:Uncharacterized protein n=1 Tax=Hypoxylon rubiginosum TaxID=110542 RepID=A0ACC0CQ45_9PEZI|nr:hypothetical protein F4821DRAFT_214247 [Hypoxylon rubiginosum]
MDSLEGEIRCIFSFFLSLLLRWITGDVSSTPVPDLFFFLLPSQILESLPICKYLSELLYRVRCITRSWCVERLFHTSNSSSQQNHLSPMGESSEASKRGIHHMVHAAFIICRNYY